MGLRRIFLPAVLVMSGCWQTTISPTTAVGPAEVDHPSAWYLLNDGNWLGRDSSGNHRDGIPFGLTDLQDDSRGTVANFPGSPTINALVVATTFQLDLTISLWLKTTQQVSEQTGWVNGPRIIDADVSGCRLDFGLGLAADKLALGIGNPQDCTADSTSLKSQRPVVDGKWHHIALTRNGQTGAWLVFVDGALDAQKQGTSGALASAKTITFGDLGNTSPVSPALHADLSDVRIYDRVLSAPAVAFLATQ